MGRSGAPAGRGRVRAARGLAAGGCLATLVAAVGVWARRQLLDTDRWVRTSDDLLREPAIRDELASYLAGQLAGTSGLRAPAERLARQALGSPTFESLWRTTSRATHAHFVALVRSERHAELTLDLRPLLVRLAEQAGLPPSLLPPDSGRVRVLRPDQLDAVRDGADVLDAVARWSVALTAATFSAAFALGRTRMLTTAGVGLQLVGLLLLAGRSLAGAAIADELARRGRAEEAAQATWSIATSRLKEIATGLALTGAASAAIGLAAKARA
ncbi:MAG: hypothetical protein QOG63_3085 [Thermoleophilaceae bacterium]|nr:hypothetical protein [Thermoleophilaceae bacterium]